MTCLALYTSAHTTANSRMVSSTFTVRRSGKAIVSHPPSTTLIIRTPAAPARASRRPFHRVRRLCSYIVLTRARISSSIYRSNSFLALFCQSMQTLNSWLGGGGQSRGLNPPYQIGGGRSVYEPRLSKFGHQKSKDRLQPDASLGR